MAHKLPPFRVTPEEWARVNLRKDLWRVVTFRTALTLGLLGLAHSYLKLPAAYVAVAVVGSALISPWAHYRITLDGLRKQKGLPWEEQRVVLDDAGLRTDYESGFSANVPWAKVVRTERFPEGFLFHLEGGRAFCFLPARAVDAEAEAIILRPSPPT